MTTSRLRTIYDLMPAPIKSIAPKRTNSVVFGFLFDLFQRDLRIGTQTFTIPRDLTNRSFRSRFFFGVYEKEEIILAKRYLRPGMNVLELGGCLGVVSCVVNDTLKKTGKQVVVEANPKLVPILLENRKRNQCTFDVEHGMVSRTSTGKFFLHDLIVGGSAKRSTSQEVRVPVFSVDDLQAKHNAHFDALICDIEGGELEFVLQNPALLKQLKVAILEIHRDILSASEIDTVCKSLSDSGLVMKDRMDQTEAWVRP